ncbi:MAG: polysaccharide biosynthesis C-terminal domain-containing protein [Verrucomicrobia bacterium]|nr:polysaccharide biosynthesis C-terminal domain-containing protein [Verrucomicrobiota bacterium]
MTFWQDIRATLSLAWPMIIGFMAAMGLLLTDGLMIGRLGVDPLAAYTFGSMVVSVFMVAGYGLCAAQHVRGADAYARRDAEAAAGTLRAGILICSAYGAVCGLLFLSSGTLLNWFGQEPLVVELAVGYTIWVGWAIIPNLVFQNFKNACEAQEHPWVPLFFYLPGLLLNVLLNWLLIYGNWGFPQLGVTGAGIATFLSKVVMLFSLVCYIKHRNLLLLPVDAWTTLRTSMARVKAFLNIGIPTGLQTLFEHLMFVVVAIWMGWLGANELAAHQIAFSFGQLLVYDSFGFSFCPEYSG